MEISSVQSRDVKMEYQNYENDEMMTISKDIDSHESAKRIEKSLKNDTMNEGIQIQETHTLKPPSNPDQACNKSQKPIVNVRLESVLSLRQEVEEHQHGGLTDILSNHTFVGVVDGSLALIQHGTTLYSVNYSELR